VFFEIGNKLKNLLEVALSIKEKITDKLREVTEIRTVLYTTMHMPVTILRRHFSSGQWGKGH